MLQSVTGLEVTYGPVPAVAGVALEVPEGEIRAILGANGAGKTSTIKAILVDWADALWTQGERFGTIGAKRGERSFEVTTHRAEVYDPGSRKPDVVYADAIEADLSRRDSGERSEMRFETSGVPRPVARS